MTQTGSSFAGRLGSERGGEKKIPYMAQARKEIENAFIKLQEDYHKNKDSLRGDNLRFLDPLESLKLVSPDMKRGYLEITSSIQDYGFNIEMPGPYDLQEGKHYPVKLNYDPDAIWSGEQYKDPGAKVKRAANSRGLIKAINLGGINRDDIRFTSEGFTITVEYDDYTPEEHLGENSPPLKKMLGNDAIRVKLDALGIPHKSTDNNNEAAKSTTTSKKRRLEFDGSVLVDTLRPLFAAALQEDPKKIKDALAGFWEEQDKGIGGRPGVLPGSR